MREVTRHKRSAKVNKHLFFRSLATFASLNIAGGLILVYCIYMYNWYFVFVRVGAWDLLVLVENLFHGFVMVSAALVICTLDAFMLKQGTKVCVCALITFIMVIIYLRTRFVDEFWSTTPVVWWLQGVSPKPIALSLQLQASFR